jgi:serine/threonine protein phosphatase PrpC
LKAFALTDVGKNRVTNQDYVYCKSDAVGNLPNIFIVADGMGGHKAGDIASVTAVDAVLKSIEQSQKTDVISIMEEAVREANKTLYEKSKSNEEWAGMGTTLVLATVVDSTIFVANIGDSRLYLIDDGIHQITRDHSYVEEMVSIGEIDKSEARTHSKKNIITRAIGVEEETHADFFEVQFKKGDKLLMCSDGLTNMIEDNDILSVIAGNNDIESMVHKLIDLANDSGGKDNIAVLIAEL